MVIFQNNSQKPPIEGVGGQPQPQTGVVFPSVNKVSNISQSQGQPQTLINNKTVIPNINNQNKMLLSNSGGDADSMRFVNIRYRIYVFFLVLVAILGFDPLTDIYDQYQGSISAYEQKELYFQSEVTKYNKYSQQQAFINNVNKNQSDIISCLNLENGCDQLDKKISEKLPVVRSYLQLGKLESKKMEVDEKKILQNLNEFLMVENPFAEKKERNGKFVGVDIGSPSLVKNKLREVPISMQINFLTKEDVLSFLNNLENRIFRTELYGFDKTILYKIDELNYDIMNYETTQDVDIKLTAYFQK